MEAIRDVENIKILPLDESMFEHNIDNIHFNSIGSYCELRLDEMLHRRLKELLGEDGIYIDSDFGYSVKDGEVNSMILYFDFTHDALKTDKKDIYIDALKKILEELFETNPVSLIVNEKNSNAKWIISGKEQMLSLIDNLNRLTLYTHSTFKVVNR